jgi:FkbH-like protein
MRLIEALETIRRPAGDDSLQRKMLLAVGFTPIHLQTFLAAHLRTGVPSIDAIIQTGLYGDLAGTLEQIDPLEFDLIVTVIEWSDLDARLGLRSLGGWRPQVLEEILSSIEAASRRIHRALSSAARAVPIVAALPTLPLPPMFTTHSAQESAVEARLHGILALAAEGLAQIPGLRLISPQALSLASPLAARYDLKSDLHSGFPYTNSHASTLASHAADLIRNRPPAKGLITDLDDTLWAGIAGDDGISALSWSLDGHTYLHAIYQNLLASFASAGVLLGVATKNDLDTVELAFQREDLLLRSSDIFPIEAHWSPKSQSVARILKTWNIAADAVVFVDDNPAEIAEVQAAFPQMDCRLFPKNDYAAAWSFFHALRDAFGKPAVSGEDGLRLDNIRASSPWRAETEGDADPSEEFLAAAGASIVFECTRSTEDTRALELLNKTNQFNLNGRRVNEAEWRRMLDDSGTFLLTSSYEDKFGNLGKIAVLLGSVVDDRVEISSWVMSCRAFSRRIEYQCLKFLFEHFHAAQVVLDYQVTPRNTAVTGFLAALLDAKPAPGAIISREAFLARLPALHHRVEENAHV